MISSLVDAGEISTTSSGIATDSAIGIVSADAQAPAMQLAPSATIFSTDETAACWSSPPPLSSWTISTV